MKNSISKDYFRLTFIAAVIYVMGIFGLANVHAFIPTNLYAVGGVLGTSHQKITEESIKALDEEFFGITKLTKPMKKAIKQIVNANADVDKDQFSSAKHFDGENFSGGQQIITNVHLPAIKQALQNDNAQGARASLGAALHTIQDFYSHSTWIEMGNSGPHPDLGRSSQTIGSISPPGEATCQDCIKAIPPFCNDCDNNIITLKLTSGYYGGEDRSKPNPQKCSHGGAFDSSASSIFGFGINKDSTDCLFSPHYKLHALAVSAAKEATKQFIRDIKAEISESELKLLLGVGPTLAFAIDVTGSMGSVISQVKSQSISIVNARLGTEEEPSKYVLVPFSDPGVGPTTVTTNPDIFKARISGLGASGGGDCPELSMSGMLSAESSTDEGGSLFMFTDASSKDSGLAGAVASLAVAKKIKIYPITFGSCSPIDPAYIRIANDSGGQVFELNVSEAGAITKLADFIVRSNSVDVLSVADNLDVIPRSTVFPVDSTLSNLTISISGATTAAVTDPSGHIVNGSDANVTEIPLSTGVIYRINSPLEGGWEVNVNGSGKYSLNVSGESGLDLTTFEFVELSGRPGHEGFFPLAGLPILGVETDAVAVMSPGFQTAKFELRDKAGNVLNKLAFDHGPGQGENEFSGKVTLMPGSFLVYVTGEDLSGKAYQRVVTSITTPQTLKVDAPLPQNLPPGVSTDYVFKVTNLGAKDTFSFTASDDQGFVSGISPSGSVLDTGENIMLTVSLSVPSGTEPGTSDTLIVVAQSNSNSELRNFAVVNSSVGSVLDTTSPVINSIVATPNQLWPPNHQLVVVSLSIDVNDNQDSSPICGIESVSS
ncbi:VWA domain-containing protein, partial [Beggiatoa alba]|nr:VWA domain-containing protein [Beggiatoa alba]